MNERCFVSGYGWVSIRTVLTASVSEVADIAQGHAWLNCVCICEGAFGTAQDMFILEQLTD